ncbi:MAG: FliA/WhiG family RNA polymerase sigma factor [bacterium]|jgi:RNA polymerase sigma factor for flagellar operon FliA
MSLTPVELTNAWRRYKGEHDPSSRDKLINQYTYLVKITAGRVITSLPPGLERDDLVSAGAVGLIKAVDQFDLTRNVKFETYAIALIRGAILEMLREEDWVPRSVRERLKNLERTYRSLELQLGRPATEEETAVALGLNQTEYQSLLLEMGRTTLLSLDDILSSNESDDQLHLADLLEDHQSDTGIEVEAREINRSLSEGVERLPEREKLVIALYYYEGLTFKEIGRVLSVSESRVYQLHTQAMVRLRSYLAQGSTLFQR